MSYTPINWDEYTPITAVNLDIMDMGINDNEGRITTNENDISSLETEQSNQDDRITTNENDISDIEDGNTLTNANQYKGNDIDTDGDGKVDEAEQADNADLIEGKDIKREAFSISSNASQDFTLTDGESKRLYYTNIYLPSNKKLVLKHIRGMFFPDIIIRVGTTEYKTDHLGNTIDQSVDFTLSTTDDSNRRLDILLENNEGDSYDIDFDQGFWLFLMIENQ